MFLRLEGLIWKAVLAIVLETCYRYPMSEVVRAHYNKYPYPCYPLAASIRRCDTYALNLSALWTRFNRVLLPPEARRILIAGCGSFSPYPFAVANPEIPIVALDLSRRNIQRARLHCFLHGRFNVSFNVGDLCQPQSPGAFGLIDAYGVLHHLEDPLAGLKALADRLAAGGIIRIMLYNRINRRQEEAIRRALRMVKIQDAKKLKRLLARAKPGSRLHRFMQDSCDASSVSGLADALLHPCVHTYQVDEFLELVDAASLKPLFFIHANAREDVGAEIKRLRLLESQDEAPGNFIAFLGKNSDPQVPEKAGSLLMLNPCLRGNVGSLRCGTLRILPRLGHPTPLIGRSQRRFLRRFVNPTSWDVLQPADRIKANEYLKALFLLRYQP